MTQSITLEGKTPLDVYLAETDQNDVILTIANNAISIDFLGVTMEQLKQFGSFIALYAMSKENEMGKEAE